MYREQPTIRSLTRELVADSIKRKKLLTKLLTLVRQDERNRVLAVTAKARARAADR